eukprot:791239-Pyramimonas_sp.AAC.1
MLKDPLYVSKSQTYSLTATLRTRRKSLLAPVKQVAIITESSGLCAGGRVWEMVRDLEGEFDPLLEWSDPSVLETPDGWVHATYTYSDRRKGAPRVCIKYLSFTMEWFKRHRWRKGYTQGMYIGRETYGTMEEDPGLIT